MHLNLQTTLLILYAIPMALLCVYGANVYLTLFLFLRSHKKNTPTPSKTSPDAPPSTDWPMVMTQIPVYNEYNVIERCMNATVEIDYPKNRHLIQILDDSNDATQALIDQTTDTLRTQGHQINIIRRDNRIGYKAGALEHGLTQNDIPYIAIFDADFVPTKDFLKRTITELQQHPKAGFVQARWGHLNATESRLTWAQHIGIDGHFTIEQPARAWNDLYMNFNGTAGLWRRQAITDAGGWQHDTLTEDMDLSYRCQFVGWQARFLLDLVVPAELPHDIASFKSQQFRWAKGSIQTAKKLLPRLWKQPIPLHKKIHATLHLTHYSIHPLMCIMALLSMPFVLLVKDPLPPAIYATLLTLIYLSCIAPTLLYAISQKILYGRIARTLWGLPLLTLLGTGIALSNTRAVFEALTGKISGFIRTPKRGDNTTITYHAKQPVLPLLELLLGLYCLSSVAIIFTIKNHALAPFLILYAASFLYVGGSSLKHALRNRLSVRRQRQPLTTLPDAEPT